MDICGYLFIERMIKLPVVITKEYYCYISYVQNCVQHVSLKVNSIWSLNYWGLSVWVSM
jgi:hypothetical protein